MACGEFIMGDKTHLLEMFCFVAVDAVWILLSVGLFVALPELADSPARLGVPVGAAEHWRHPGLRRSVLRRLASSSRLSQGTRRSGCFRCFVVYLRYVI